MMCEVSIRSCTSPVWRDLADSPLMVKLPGNEFVMGENVGDKFSNDTERPAHRVGFASDFAVSRDPVTVGQFRAFQPGHRSGDEGELPVVWVNWREALAYCEWLSGRAGREYRLPSEAEWEYACRAGSRTPFASGEELSPAQANYYYDEQGQRVGLGRRTSVGSYPANAFGLHDLHGNVCEWVADAWHPDYLEAPTDGRAWMSSGDGPHRVIRGGAWDYLPRLLRCAWRDWRPMDFRADNIGFRVATGDLKGLSAHEP